MFSGKTDSEERRRDPTDKVILDCFRDVRKLMLPARRLTRNCYWAWMSGMESNQGGLTYGS